MKIEVLNIGKFEAISGTLASTPITLMDMESSIQKVCDEENLTRENVLTTHIDKEYDEYRGLYIYSIIMVVSR